MKKKFFRTSLAVLILIILSINFSYSEIIKKIQIQGNERISNDTILLFGKVSLNDNLKKDDLNLILKRLYDTNYFKNVSVLFNNNLLSIQVLENPIIENINYKGVKADKILEALKENALIKPRLSFNEIILAKSVLF